MATTAAGEDLAPPTYVVDPDVVLTTDVQTTLAWTADEAASATIEHGPVGSDSKVRQPRRRLESQQVTLTNLKFG